MQKEHPEKSSIPQFNPDTGTVRSGHFSPTRLFIFIIASIFFAEIIAMAVVYFIPPLPYHLIAVVDAGIMLTLIFPILYRFSFYPLIQHIEKLQQTEVKLGMERSRLRSILDTMPDGIYIVNQQYDVEYVNPVIEREFGPVGGQKCYSYFHDANEACHWCKNAVVFAGKSVNWEWSSSKTGKTYDVFDTPLANSDGSLSKLKVIHDITERKRNEEAVRLLSSVVEQTADTVVVTDCEGVIEYVNPAFEALTGYSREDVLGQTPSVLKSGYHDQPFYNKLWETVLDAQVFHGEIINRKKNGDLFYEAKTISPLRDVQGNITHFVATGKDITERREAEEKLRRAYDDLEVRVHDRTEELRIANSELEDEINVRRRAEQALQLSEQRLKRAQEIAHLGSWELDLLNDQLTWSDEVYRIFGLEPQEFRATYEAFLEAVHPDDRAAVNEAYLTSIRDGSDAYEIEHRVVKRSSGEVRTVHEKCEHFRNQAGEIIRSGGMVHDITERKQAEAQLQYQAALLSNLSDAIIASDAQYRLTAWNSAAETLYGWKAEEVLGRNGVEIVRTEWINTDPDAMRHIIAETGLWRGEATQQRKDGTRFPVEASAIVLRDASGQITGYVSVNRDITQRKQIEEQLARSNQKLNEILASIQDDFYVLDRDWNFIYANSLFTAKVEKEPQDFIGNNIWTMFPKHVGTALEENFRAAMEKREVRRFELSGKYTNAWYRMTVFPSAEGITVIGTDISDRKKAERELQQLNRTLQAMSASNQAMMRATSEAELLNEVCNIVVKDCGYAMVWIGYAEHDEGKSVRPMASAGFEAGYLETLKITWADTERGQGPTGMAIRTGKPRSCRNMLTDPQFAPWRDQAQQRGYASSLVLPLVTNGQAFGAITIYSREPDAFSADEERLLTELASDLTHGIETIRLREVRALIEAQLRLARDELEIRVEKRTAELAAANRELSDEIAERKEIERQLRIQTAAMDAAANGILITDSRGRILWTNSAISQISGYEARDLVGENTHIFSSGMHDAAFYKEMWETILSGHMWRGEITNRRKDGTLYVEEQTITPVPNEDAEISHFIAVKQDVTERKLIYAQLEDSNRELQTLTASERQQRFLAEGLVASSVALNMSLELHAVLDRIFEQTRRTIPYLMADIVLIEEGVANVVRQWGEGDPEAKTISENDNLPLRQFPIWETICATKSTYMITDTDLDDQWDGYFGMTWIRSYIGAPLIYDDQVIGIINLSSDQPNEFHEEMAKNLRAFAAPAAVAIQNARLYEDEKQNRKVAEILSAASVALAQTLDIEMVMETILDYMQFILPLDVALVLLSEGDERYRVRAIRTESDDRAKHEILQGRIVDILSEPVVGAYFAKNESTFIPDVRQIADWSPPLELASMNCWLGIPLASVGKALGMVVIAHATPYSFTKDQIGLADAVVKQAVVALQNAWLFEQVRSGRERLQQLSRHLVEIQENERKYIARELHDETSQSLTSLKMGLQVIEQKAAGHPQLMEQVATLKNLADETLESLHHLAVNLRPASLDHLGLVDALTSLIESIRQRSGMAAHFKIMGVVEAELTDEIESSIYRIVQESLTNAVRHSHANYVDVILEWQADKIVVIIEDDGVGIDMQKARETGHLGLIGMQERAEMLGGKLLVDSTPQVGTILVVEIPYVNSNTDSR